MDDKQKQKIKEENPQLYRVAFEKGTELPGTGKYEHEKAAGMYCCAVCQSELFDSNTKFDSGSGWPSFDKAIDGAVTYHDDSSMGMERTEVTCTKCGAHLGHVFNDGPQDTTGKRYCINSVCLDLEKTTDQENAAQG